MEDDRDKKKNNYILFRAVPTMRCNYRCNYCFVSPQEKSTTKTMFDKHTPDEWIRAMKNFEDYQVEFYFWGGEPFIIDGTYELVKGWVQYDHVISGSRIDTNMAFSDKIAEKCPTDKLKLNCSWHTQYDSLDGIYKKVKNLNDMGMVGMTNFVASQYNLKVIQDKYHLSIDELIERFNDIGVFLNIAADFSIVNDKDPSTYAEYKNMILKYLCPEDWRQLRCEKSACFCEANHHYFTIHPDGNITACLSGQVCGNFFDGTLKFPECTVCDKKCASLVSYCFRKDNNFPYKRHLIEYVNRNREYRESICAARSTVFVPNSDLKVPNQATTSLRRFVSIILPTYNHLKFLPKAIESVLAQTYPNFELIIVNDGSTDGTREYLDSLKDRRVRTIHQENKRLPEALNTGFRAARGELLTWISADNYCAPIFLEAFVAALDAYPDADFAYSAHAWIDGNDQITGICKDQDVSCHRLLASGVGVTSFMYRRLCQERVGLYDPALEGAEDWDMWLRILEQFQAVYVPEILSYYRRHRESMTEKVKERIFRASQQTFQKAVKRRNNQFDIAELYPTLGLCRDIETAKFYAYFDLGITLLQSQFTQVELGCQVLEKALLMRHDSFEVAGNLALIYGQFGLWEKVAPLLRRISQKPEDPKALEVCRSIVEAHKTNRPDLLAKIPLFIPDKESIELFQLEKKQKRVFSFTDAGQRKNVYAEQGMAITSKRPESNSTGIELKKEVRENFKIGMAVLACERPEYLEICLDTLFQTKLYNYDITFLLQDDGSTDPRVRDIIEKPRDPKYKIVRFHTPKGHNSWGAAFNKAMRKLLEIDDFDIIGSCDSDALFHPEWLDKTMKICLWAKKNHTDHILGPFSSFNSSDYKFHKILGTYESPYGGYVAKERMGAVNYFYFKEDFIKLGFFEEHRDDETLMTEKFKALQIRNFSTKTSYVEHIGEVSVLNQWRPGSGAFGAHAMNMAKTGWPAVLGQVGTLGYFKYIHKNVSLEPARYSNTKIDILIPVVEKDLDILPLVIDGARENLKHPIGRIFVIAPQSHEIKSVCSAKGCEFVSEDTVLPIIKKNLTYTIGDVDRSGWLFQQLIKLAGDSICSQEHYLALDADTVLIRPQVFEVGGKMLLLHSDEHHHPYFELYKRLFGVEAKTMLSFVSHHILFKSSLVSEFKRYIEKRHNINWVESLFKNIDTSQASGMSEYELYGQWMFANHPDKITREYWFNISLQRQMYTPELEARLKRCCRSISFHDYNTDTLVETPFIQSAPVPTANQHRSMLTEGLEHKKPVLVGSRVSGIVRELGCGKSGRQLRM